MDDFFICCHLTTEKAVRKCLFQNHTLSSRPSLTKDHILNVYNVCILPKYHLLPRQGEFLQYRQKDEKGSPVSPAVATLHMEEVESRAL